VVDEEDIQVEDPSGQYGGSWDNQRVGGTVLGDAEPVREVAERYRETADAGVVMDTRAAEGTDSRVKEVCKTVSVSAAVPLLDMTMEAEKEREHYLRGKKIWARRRRVVHWCGGASVLTRSHGAEEEASGTMTKASYLQADQRVVRV
jgi:hypothetical protein